MTPTESPAFAEREIEELLSALHGVLAARVVAGPLGRIEEIHVLAAARMHPKQIVRNIESALSAGLGVSVDRRLISVAQLRADEPDPLAVDPPPHDDAGDDTADPSSETTTAGEQPTAAAPATAPTAATADQTTTSPTAPALTLQGGWTRYIFVGYDARTQPNLEATCRVTLRHEGEVFSGTGTGPSTALGRARAAARAVFAAIAAARRNQTLGLEAVTLVDSHGRTFVLVAAHALSGRESVPLTGVAALHRSPEEAAILAALQATNRWAQLDD